MTKERPCTEHTPLFMDSINGPERLTPCIFCQREQLRGNLSLAEDGLASATQEVQRWETEADRLQREVARRDAAIIGAVALLRQHGIPWPPSGTPAEPTLGATEAGRVIESNLGLRVALNAIQQERLTWALACECTCDACEKLSSVIRGYRTAPEPGVVDSFPSPNGRKEVLRLALSVIERWRTQAEYGAVVSKREELEADSQLACDQLGDALYSAPSAAGEVTTEASGRLPAEASGPATVRAELREVMVGGAKLMVAVEGPGPMQVQHPAPCWCPYCGEPHSPKVQEVDPRLAEKSSVSQQMQEAGFVRQPRLTPEDAVCKCAEPWLKEWKDGTTYCTRCGFSPPSRTGE